MTMNTERSQTVGADSRGEKNPLGAIVGLSILIILGISLLLTPDDEKSVTASQYGSEWPFEIYTEGTIKCRIGDFGGIKRPLVTIELGQSEYGLNGAAIGVGKFPDSRPLLRRDPKKALLT